MEHESSLPYSQQPANCSYQRNSFHAPFLLYFFTVHLGLQSHISLLPVSFLQIYPPKLFMYFFVLHTCHMSRPSHSLRFQHTNKTGETQITELRFVSFFPVCCYVPEGSRTKFSAPPVYTVPPSTRCPTFPFQGQIQLQAKLQLWTFKL